MTTFHQFLEKIRPVINITGLETVAGIPARTIHKHFAWVDGKEGGARLPDQHIAPIVHALCHVFGCIEVNGWAITSEPDTPAFFATRPIPDRPVLDTEITDSAGATHFEYHAPQYRQVLDEWDLIEFFK